MNNKVTKITFKYPEGQEPNLVVPEEYTSYRYVIGKTGKTPLVAICMNPSAARDNVSDKTVNEIIKTSKILNNDGWIVVNTYPERATEAKNMDVFNEDLMNMNVQAIEKIIKKYGIKEVYGAWGDLEFRHLKEGKTAILKMLKKHKVKVFYFGSLTQLRNPRHPLQTRVKRQISKDHKNYLDF